MANTYQPLRVSWRDLRWMPKHGPRDYRLTELEDSIAKVYAPVNVRGPLEWCDTCHDATPHNEGQGCAHCYWEAHYKDGKNAR